MIKKGTLTIKEHLIHRFVFFYYSWIEIPLTIFFIKACEQLNSWLGGFESILKRMKPGNFNWFLHTMLFYHTRNVLAKQKKKKEKDDDDDSDDSDDGDDNV